MKSCVVCGKLFRPEKGKRPVARCPKHNAIYQRARSREKYRRLREGVRYGGKSWRTARQAALERDGHTCQQPGCGRTDDLCVHHVRPLAQGGDHSLGNLLTLCRRCHQDAEPKPR